MNDYKCPNCGGSFSLPLGMSCDDHHPEPVEIGDPEDLPHYEEILDGPEAWILANFTPEPDEELSTELQFAAIMVMGTKLTAMGLDPDLVAESLAVKNVRITINQGGEGAELHLDFYDDETDPEEGPA